VGKRVKQRRQNTFRRLGSLLAGLVVCVSPAFSVADNSNNLAPQALNANQPLVLLPLQKEAPAAGLEFDLGGSETRKLELQLSKPLILDINNNLAKSSSGIGSVFLDSSLSLQLNDKLDITSSLGAGKSQAPFQSLGSIHCQNGMLDQGSFRASDCYFINQANVLKQDQVALGLRYGNDNLSTAVSMFKYEASMGQQGVINHARPMTSPV